MNDKSLLTDKELLEEIGRNSPTAFAELKKRYSKRIESIYRKLFYPIRKTLRYELMDLYSDIEQTIWGDLLVKSLDSLEFNEKGSIGGLIDTMAKGCVLDKYTRTINHRSQMSTDKRKKCSENNENVGFDFNFSDFEDEDLDLFSTNDPADQFQVRSVVEKLFKQLAPEQRSIYYYKSIGLGQKEIATVVGLTQDQVRTHLKNINKEALILGLKD